MKFFLKDSTLLFFIRGCLSLFILTSLLLMQKSFDINYYMNSFKENNIEEITIWMKKPSSCS